MKLTVDPDTVQTDEVVEELKLTTLTMLAWARAVLDRVATERGVFQHDGLMVDAPVLRRAERIVALAP